MPLLKKIEHSGAIMGIWKQTESLSELEAQYSIHESEKQMYQGFRNDRRRKEWLTARILLETLIGKDAEICYRDSGKPYLRDGRYCISITHTIGYVGIRLAAHPVALDMEYYSDRVLHLIPRYVAHSEMQYVSMGDKITSALIIWSAKETLYKLFDFQDVLFDEHIFVSELDPTHTNGHFKGTIQKESFHADVNLTYVVLGELILVYC
ncbi:MAG: hypothetical protein J6Y72_07510 [Bacteroidales bacterium]|jgi:4'-phosphopantetheinyl transferase EntD|nr:hypothetical protein [Bacteroidales bacterium]MBP5419640.1 hypothetical protein [Bacteroidales bacterium]MCR5695642.1 hypothetical protein [Marinilabiliaceae bacterium]